MVKGATIFFDVLIHVEEAERLKIFSKLTSIPVQITYMEDDG